MDQVSTDSSHSLTTPSLYESSHTKKCHNVSFPLIDQIIQTSDDYLLRAEIVLPTHQSKKNMPHCSDSRTVILTMEAQQNPKEKSNNKDETSQLVPNEAGRDIKKWEEQTDMSFYSNFASAKPVVTQGSAAQTEDLPPAETASTLRCMRSHIGSISNTAKASMTLGHNRNISELRDKV